MRILVRLLIVAALVGMAHAQLVVAPMTATCATSVDGSVVGLPNPLRGPTLSEVYSGGTLPAGNYFVQVAWYDSANHVTLVSPEVQGQMTATGTLNVTRPSGMPSAASGMQVFIGTSSGAETLQGTTSGSAVYSQVAPLNSGTAVPALNTTICKIIANDSGWPTGTGYDTTLVATNGQTYPGYPVRAQFLGPGNNINLGQGFPRYNGVVNYPVPILAQPYGHGPQSISGPLSLGSGGSNYNLTSVGRIGILTATPAWGVDAEGAGLSGAINANVGYLFNGSAPLNHLLVGNGSYYVDSATIPGSALNLFYQTVALNGTAQTQRPTLNFSSYFTATDSASPAETTIAPVTTGSETKLVTAASAGTSGDCAQWDSSGGLGAASAPCQTGVTHGGSATGCLSSGSPCSTTITWNGGGFTSSTYSAVCWGSGLNSGGSQAAFVYETSQTATQIVVTTSNVGTTNPGGFATIICIGTSN